ncbi:MAG: acylneuraminate cytidylyltransferase family protein [Phycisphaerales bacterium]|nr:acylneuraminate cytidylyltransferase family protein [Phycisphaerales bacterium]
MSTLAIILARAGSKGLPEKNVREIAGKPCIAWTIEAARDAAGVHDVLVSTDCAAAARCASHAGVGVVDRPRKLATDDATVDDAARDMIAQTGHTARVIVLLYANVPVRPANLIDRALGLCEHTRCDSVQSYARVGKHHPWWTCRVDEVSGTVAPWEGDVLNHGLYRRQDLPAAYVPDGGVLVVSRAALMLEVSGVAPGPHAFLGKDRRGIITNEGDVVDIDTEIDAIVAEAVLQKRASAMAGAGR